MSVYRNSNISQTIDYKNLVVGDVFRFNKGNIIPADSIIIEGSNIECQEKNVTGEQGFKNKGVLNQDDIRNEAEISNILYAKSYILRGHGTAVVCAVGHRT